MFAKTGTLVAGDDSTSASCCRRRRWAGTSAAGGSWIAFNVVVNDAGGDQTVQPVLAANEDVGEIAAFLWAEANP